MGGKCTARRQHSRGRRLRGSADRQCTSGSGSRTAQLWTRTRGSAPHTCWQTGTSSTAGTRAHSQPADWACWIPLASSTGHTLTRACVKAGDGFCQLSAQRCSLAVLLWSLGSLGFWLVGSLAPGSLLLASGSQHFYLATLFMHWLSPRLPDCVQAHALMPFQKKIMGARWRVSKVHWGQSGCTCKVAQAPLHSWRVNCSRRGCVLLRA
mmetsp:Transcript_14242/g.36427  ORF Transcript_14242/g.36427 Transcript_14242/m.36427 type:complete len:209 (-) Transcript_14242:9-635(-)